MARADSALCFAHNQFGSYERASLALAVQTMLSGPNTPLLRMDDFPAVYRLLRESGGMKNSLTANKHTPKLPGYMGRELRGEKVPR